MTGRRDFLSQPAPENYVAGLGRGATGFTTRSDLGPAREGPSEEQIKAAVAKRSKELGFTDGKDKDDDDKEDDPRFQDPDNEVGLFAGGIYEKDDEEADEIWRNIDDRMAKRRQKQRLVIPSFYCLRTNPQSMWFIERPTDEQITDKQ
jgi:pre-mRNA-processing factor 6